MWPETQTTADRDGTLFGVHIPEVQLDPAEYRAAFTVAQLQAGERYVELGSGHGHGVVMAAAEFGALACGIDYLEDALDRTRVEAGRRGVGQLVELERADVRTYDARNADVLYMHLGPAFHDVLAAQLESQLSPVSRVIAAGWKVPGWQPVPGTQEQWTTGYLYRPADPHLHCSWATPVRAPGDGGWLVELHVHADLSEIEIRPSGRVDRRTLLRGQSGLVWIPDAAGPSIEIWAHARDGRFTRRGPSFDTSHWIPEQRPEAHRRGP